MLLLLFFYCYDIFNFIFVILIVMIFVMLLLLFFCYDIFNVTIIIFIVIIFLMLLLLFLLLTPARLGGDGHKSKN